MGISTEAWRARIGAFLPTARFLSCHQRRIWPHKMRFKTYKRPPDEPKTHHVNMEILVCLILLLVACVASWTDPLKGIRDLGFFRVAVSSILMHLGFNYPKEKTWKNLGMRIALVVLLLLCGDVESNPGPNGIKRKQETDVGTSRLPKMPSGSKQVHVVRRTDINDKFETNASSLEILWMEIHDRWNDVDQTNYILSEEDGTDVSDEGYFQSFENKIVLHVRPKITEMWQSHDTYSERYDFNRKTAEAPKRKAVLQKEVSHHQNLSPAAGFGVFPGISASCTSYEVRSFISNRENDVSIHPERFQMSYRRSKMYRILRTDRQDNFETRTSSLKMLWMEVVIRWQDVDQIHYIISEEDGTDISDEGYFQSLKNDVRLLLRPKNREFHTEFSVGDSFSSLTDDMIQEIARNRILDKNIVKLGSAMRISLPRIENYRKLNTRSESKGTYNMIRKWRDATTTPDQVRDFCRILEKAQLKELADDLSKGRNLANRATVEDHILWDLQDNLKRNYTSELCYLRTIPDDVKSAMPIKTHYKVLHLFYRTEKPQTTTHKEDPHKTNETNVKNYTDMSLNESCAMSNHTFKYLKHSYEDIFHIKDKGFLIYGKSGIGKTSMFKRIAFDWSECCAKPPISQVKLLIYLSLNGVKIDAKLGDEVIRQRLPKEVSITCDNVEQCISRHEQHIVILLDDFDDSVFAKVSPSNLVDNENSLFNTILKRKFVNSRVFVTTRSYEKIALYENLFNRFIHIVVEGFSRSSVKADMADYNQGISEHTELEQKQLLNSSALLPILHVPVFFFLTWSMARVNLYLKPPFSLTNIIAQFCTYLLRKFVYYSEAEKVQIEHSDRFERALCILGEREWNGVTLLPIKSSEEYKLIEFAKSVGIISAVDTMDPSTSPYMFFHPLIRIYCIAKYHFYSDPTEKPKPADFSDIELHYLMVFFSGLNPLLAFQLMFSDDLLGESYVSFIRKSIYGDSFKDFPPIYIFRLQSFFESRNDNGENNNRYFRGSETLVVDMDFFHSLAATHYVLSKIKQSETGLHFSRLYFSGGALTASFHPEDNANKLMYAPHVFDISTLSGILSRSPFLASIAITNWKIKGQYFGKRHGSKFERIKHISIETCQGIQIVKEIVTEIAAECPSLSHLYLSHIFQEDKGTPDRLIDMEDILLFLSIVGSSCETLVLERFSCSPADLNDNKHVSPLKSLTTISLDSGEEMIEIAYVLSYLCLYCPNLNALCIKDSMINTDEASLHFQRIRSDQMVIKIAGCKQQINTLQLLHIISMYYPKTKNIILHSSEVSVRKLQSSNNVVLDNLEELVIEQCSRSLVINDFFTHLRSEMKILPKRILFLKCDVTVNDRNITPELRINPYENLYFSHCSLSEECILFSVMCCKCLTVKQKSFPCDILEIPCEFKVAQDKDGNVTTGTIFCQGLIIKDCVVCLLKIFPMLKSLIFHISQTINIRPSSTSTPSESAIECVIFQTLESNGIDINAFDALRMVTSWFPRATSFVIRGYFSVQLTFAKESFFVNQRLQNIFFSDCVYINFTDIVAHLKILCPNTKYLEIRNINLLGYSDNTLERVAYTVSMNTHVDMPILLIMCKCLNLEEISRAACSASVSTLIYVQCSFKELKKMVGSCEVIKNIHHLYFSKCSSVFNDARIIPFVLTTFPNLENIILDGCDETFENLPENLTLKRKTTDMPTIQLRNCGKTSFRNFVRYITPFSSAIRRIYIEDCQAMFATHTIPLSVPFIQNIEDITVVFMTVDIESILLSVKSVFTKCTNLHICSSDLKSNPSMNVEGKGVIEKLEIHDCAFPPSIVPYLAKHCSTMYIQVSCASTHDCMFYRGSNFASVCSHGSIELFSNNDMNQWYKDYSCLTVGSTENDFSSEVRYRLQSTQEIMLPGLGRSVDLHQAISFLSAGCPALKILRVYDAIIPPNHYPQEKITTSLCEIMLCKCQNVDFLNIMSFLTTSIPTVQCFKFVNCNLRFEYHSCQTSNLRDTSIQLIHLCDCDVPSNFEQLIRTALPILNLSYSSVCPGRLPGKTTCDLWRRISPNERPPCMEVI